MRSPFAACLWVVALAIAWPFPGRVARGAEPASDAPDAAQVEFFEKKVRPLLVARCYECHAIKTPKGNLRLDSRAGLLKGGDTGAAVVPGKPDESLLVDAIRYGDTYQMPPKSQLPPEEIATLVEWVRLGAPWSRETAADTAHPDKTSSEFDLAARARHWSFQPIVDATPPDVDRVDWVQTPVDRFVLHKLEAAGLAPAPSADRAALLRRVTFDLIGLPPTPREIEDFLADGSQAAYEKVVDRLLASPQYGERWARHWLDLVRFAETYGHEFDFDMPNAYRYRDYVIRALNDDLPYDQFVVEHVAGDLLAQPRRHPREGYNESIIATGFYLFGEAKHSPVDVRQDEADRIDNQIDVLAKTFLGLTVSCARCHDHKFDAISTRDYYALAGYLQSSRYQQAFIDSPDVLAGVLSSLERLRAERRETWLEFCRAAIAPRLNQLATMLSQSQIEHAASSGSAVPASLASDAIVYADFRGPDYGGWIATGAAFGSRPAGALDWTFAAPQSVRVGRLLSVPAAHSGLLSAKLQGVLRSPTFEIPKSKIHYRLHGTGGQVRLIVDGLQLIKDPIYGGLQFGHRSEEPHWHSQDVSKWIGHRAYIEVIDDGHDSYIALEQVIFSDGAPPTVPDGRSIALPATTETNRPPPSLAERYRSHIEQSFTSWLSGQPPAAGEAENLAAIVNLLLEAPGIECEEIEQPLAVLTERLADLDKRQRPLEATIDPPRQALALADGTAENERVFIRGSHKTLGEEVPRRFLEALGGTQHVPPNQGSGRLELARQMVARDNPLVARVIVNRLWHHHFGAGIVRSVDDFGAMGQPPTHPELLDFLASELVREGWSLKHMHRTMVLSNTYQMSSRPQPVADLADPHNKLWHRMTVRRLEAECVRDAILAVSGRANPTMYGPSIMPHLTEFMTGRGKPTAAGPLDGDGRRSIYLAVRRNFLAPMFLAFDYPVPFTTIGRRGASNVPAQALTMMNNPLVIEQAQRWAARVAANAEQSPAERVREMYLTALGRVPEEAELQAALAFVSGESSAVEPTADAQNAWAELAHVLFNLKEFVFIP